MEQSGFWNFFFATGLPQAYLAARLKEGEEVVFPPMPPPGAPGGGTLPPSVPGTRCICAPKRWSSVRWITRSRTRS